MGDKSKIEWTDASWTPIRARLKSDPSKVGWHCEHVGEGCRICYAEAINRRLGTGLDFKPGRRKDVEIFLDEKMLLAPLRWQRPRMIFVCSMTDAFAKFVTDEMLDKMFAVAALCPQHTLQVLTKRGARMRAYIESRSAPDEHGYPAEDVRVAMTTLAGTPSRREMAPALKAIPLGKYCQQIPWPLPNVWLGVSCEDQQRADERRDDLRLLAEQGWLTFVSYEPALGPVDWSGWEFLKWLISGGESGPKARPAHPDWHRAARDFCSPRGIAFFFKQWGEHMPGELEAERGSEGEPWRTWANGNRNWSLNEYSNRQGAGLSQVAFARVGKKAAGRLLDGREHNDRPAVAPPASNSPELFHHVRNGQLETGAA